MVKAKIAFTHTVEVPQSALDEGFNRVSDILDDWELNISRKTLETHEGVVALVQKRISDALDERIWDIDMYDYIGFSDVEKIFKSEIKAAKDKRAADEKAAALANKAEEERMRKEGRSLVVPLKDSNKAEAILRAAGINVKLLP